MLPIYSTQRCHRGHAALQGHHIKHIVQFQQNIRAVRSGQDFPPPPVLHKDVIRESRRPPRAKKKSSPREQARTVLETHHALLLVTRAEPRSAGAWEKKTQGAEEVAWKEEQDWANAKPFQRRKRNMSPRHPSSATRNFRRDPTTNTATYVSHGRRDNTSLALGRFSKVVFSAALRRRVC